jgi:predicted nucleic acid-binding protein
VKNGSNTLPLFSGAIPEPVSSISRRTSCRISVYDALYAALAQHLRAPLYTTDERLTTQLRDAIPVHTLAPLPAPS